MDEDKRLKEINAARLAQSLREPLQTAFDSVRADLLEELLKCEPEDMPYVRGQIQVAHRLAVKIGNMITDLKMAEH